MREVQNRVVVTKVIYESAAYKAGIRKDDLILSVDGEEVHYPKEVVATVISKEIGDEVKVTIMLDGKKLEISFTLEAKPAVLQEATRLIDVIPPSPKED